MSGTLGPFTPVSGKLLRLLLLLLTLPSATLQQGQLLVTEGSGTTTPEIPATAELTTTELTTSKGTTTEGPTTTEKPTKTDFKYKWGEQYGDKEHKVTRRYQEKQIIFNLGPYLPLVVKDVAHRKLVVSSNGLIINRSWFTSFPNPNCDGYTNHILPFYPTLVLSGLWSSPGLSDTTILYARRTLYSQVDLAGDFNATVDMGFAANTDDIAWVLVATIFKEYTGNIKQKNYLQMAVIVLNDFTFRFSVEYKSIYIPNHNKLFVGYCGGSFFDKKDIHKMPTDAEASSFNIVLPNDLTLGSTDKLKQRFTKAAACLSWTFKRPTWTILNIPACPCNFIQAWLSTRYSPSSFGFFSACVTGVETINGIALTVECCYRFPIFIWWFSFLSPPNSNVYVDLNDLTIKQYCKETDLYHRYLLVRPRVSCALFRADVLGAGFGDPHFVTLDGVKYTCNAIGYFRLFTLKNHTTVCDVKMEEINQASVFTGIACKDGETSGTITFDLDSASVFSISIKVGTSPAIKITKTMFDANGNYRNGGIFLMKNMTSTDTYLAKFDNGNIAVSVVVLRFPGVRAILRQTVTVASKVKSQTPSSAGLMGTFNGNTLDDFRTPEPQVSLISTNSSEKHIYFEFCIKWKLSVAGALETIYNEPSTQLKVFKPFTPSFCDEVSPTPAVVTRCNGSKQCECDAAITGSTEFADGTLVAGVEIKNLTETLDNSPPSTVGLDQILTTVGTVFLTTYSGKDPNNHSTTVEANRIPFNATFDGANLEWIPRGIDNGTRLSVTATDSTGLVGTELNVTILACDCNRRGLCLFDQLQEGYTQNDLYQVVECSCNSGWIGDHCEDDIDVCCPTCGFACFNQTTCIDLDPYEEITFDRKYNCTACNVGYYVLDSVCEDVDECTVTQTNPCSPNAACTNTEGSYTCACLTGYLVNATGTCVDIDECVTKTDNCNQTCTNTDGSFTCSCLTGYSVTNTNGCDQNAVDANTCEQVYCDPLSTICVVNASVPACVCSKGYEPDPTSNNTCNAINECANNATHACRNPATCVDTSDGYDCSCATGYLLTSDTRGCYACASGTWGTTCSGTCKCAQTATCVLATGCTACPPGVTGPSCDVNINECLAVPPVCGNNATCADTTGSYRCTCDAKYQLNATSFVCDPINMCLTMPCSTGTCVQLGVEYRCDCEVGFSGPICDQDDIVCPTKTEPCKNGGTCVELRGNSYRCDCTSDWIGADCSTAAPLPVTTTVTPVGEFSGSIKLSSTIPGRNTTEFASFVRNLTQAIKEAISDKLGVEVAVDIDRVNLDGQIFFTIITPSISNLTAADFGEAIASSLVDGKLMTSTGQSFTVITGSIQIGGVAPTAAPVEPNTVLPAVLGAVLAALFLALLAILIGFIFKRLARKAVIRNAMMSSYGNANGFRRAPPGRFWWLPKALVSGNTLAHVRPRMRPRNNPWAIDPFEPEVDPGDVNWQQWRHADNSYYNRAAQGAVAPAAMSPGLRGVTPPLPTGGAPYPQRAGPGKMMFRRIPGRPPGPPRRIPPRAAPPPPRQGLRRTRVPPFLRRTFRAIPAFFRGRRLPFTQRPMPAARPHPGLPYVAPGSSLPPPMMPEPGTRPPPMRMRMSPRSAMPGSGMGNGGFPVPARFSWGAKQS